MEFLMSVLVNVGAFGGDFLSEAGKKALSEQVIITGIVLYSLRGHFKKMEKGFDNVAEKVADLGVALTRVESSHSGRIEKLETDVQAIKKTITGE